MKSFNTKLNQMQSDLIDQLHVINHMKDTENLLEEIWLELGPYSNAISTDLRYRLQDYFGFDDNE